jgi:hypothetical protein
MPTMGDPTRLFIKTSSGPTDLTSANQLPLRMQLEMAVP